MWRAFVVRDVLLARHSPLFLCSFAAHLFSASIRLLPPPSSSRSSTSRDSFFFLRFPMRGLETRLINIAGVAASLFSRVASSQSAFTGHCTHDARMYYECRPFPPSPPLSLRAATGVHSGLKMLGMALAGRCQPMRFPRRL